MLTTAWQNLQSKIFEIGLLKAQGVPASHILRSSPSETVEMYDSLELGDVFAVIASGALRFPPSPAATG